MTRIPISEDELTEVLYDKMWCRTPRPDSATETPDSYRKWKQQLMEQSRSLARKMIAAELMYEALKERAASACKGECTAECDLHTVGCENAYSALAAAEGTANQRVRGQE